MTARKTIWSFSISVGDEITAKLHLFARLSLRTTSQVQNGKDQVSSPDCIPVMVETETDCSLFFVNAKQNVDSFGAKR